MSTDQKLITKTYTMSSTGVGPVTTVLLGTVDLVGNFPGLSYNETLVKIELSWGHSNSPIYLSAELNVLVDPLSNMNGSYIPNDGTGGAGEYPNYPIGPAAGGLNYNYSHLLYPDNSQVYNFFQIYFLAPTPHPQLIDYFQMEIYAITPNYTGDMGAVITTYYANHLPSNHDY